MLVSAGAGLAPSEEMVTCPGQEETDLVQDRWVCAMTSMTWMSEGTGGQPGMHHGWPAGDRNEGREALDQRAALEFHERTNADKFRTPRICTGIAMPARS